MTYSTIHSNSSYQAVGCLIYAQYSNISVMVLAQHSTPSCLT